MTRRPTYHADDEDEAHAGDEHYEECEVCHQEFGGICPIKSVDCPYGEFEEEEEDEDPDFEDVEKLDDLIGDDAEVEKIIEEEVEIPMEDLVDEESEAEKEPEDVGPSKTVEELEAEEEERRLAEAKKKRSAKKAPAKAKAVPKAKAPPKSKK